MNEQISALADNEIALEDAEHLMSGLQSSGPLAEAWSQYHLIGDVMRGTQVLSPSFKQNLMAKLDLEPTVLAPNAGLLNAVKTQASSVEAHGKLPAVWSIAASFAAVMVVGWMVLQMQVSDNLTPAIAGAVVPHTTATNVAAADAIPAEYLMAHQASAPSASSYYIQSASYSE